MAEQSELLTPPPPPTPSELFVKGKFDYIKPKDSNYKVMLVNAYQAVTQTESWDLVKQDRESFMFSKDQRIRIIYKKMEELGFGLHSPSSFGCIMRDMQYIAVYGEENFRDVYLNNI